ncbi:MAG TPA: Ig domain-containing protein [Actinomycetota bacterium]|nr:Ig domain-containing protein [Actinomycetota bacterium]
MRRSLAAAASLAVLTLALPAQGLEASGNEFVVNDGATTGNQTDPDVGVAENGSFVVVWESNSGEIPTPPLAAGGNSIWARRYGANGVPLAAPFQVNVYTASHQFDPAVAVDDDGNFVVVWASYGSNASDTSSASIAGRRYTSSGTASTEFQVNTTETGDQLHPDVAIDDAGNFVVTWDSVSGEVAPPSTPAASGNAVFAQRFAASGLPSGSEFQVNHFAQGIQSFPAVASDDGGDFVVVWQSGAEGENSLQDGSDGAIVARRYTAAGTPGDEILVNVATQGDQSLPDVGMDDANNFLVVWRSDSGEITPPLFQTASSYGVFGRMLPANATAGNQFQINQFVAGPQYLARVAVEDAGSFVAVWVSGTVGADGFDGDDEGVSYRRYDHEANVLTDELIPTQSTTGTQENPSVGADGPHATRFVWVGGDGNGDGVYGRLFENSPPVLSSVGNKNATEGAQLQFDLSASDPDGDGLSFSGSNLPPGATVDPDTGEFTWTPTYSQAGSYSPVSFAVSDGSSSDFEDVTITVAEGTAPPTTTTLSTGKTARKVKASGKVTPNHSGDAMKVSLLRKKNGKFVKLATKHPVLNLNSGYAAAFPRPNPGTCKVKAAFPADEDHTGSRKSATFNC